MSRKHDKHAVRVPAEWKKYSNRKKTWRRPFRKARRFDLTCRCHGSCPWCQSNRFHSDYKKELTCYEELQEVLNDSQLESD